MFEHFRFLWIEPLGAPRLKAGTEQRWGLAEHVSRSLCGVGHGHRRDGKAQNDTGVTNPYTRQPSDYRVRDHERDVESAVVLS